jgi:hypothetical protein
VLNSIVKYTKILFPIMVGTALLALAGVLVLYAKFLVPLVLWVLYQPIRFLLWWGRGVVEFVLLFSGRDAGMVGGTVLGGLFLIALTRKCDLDVPAPKAILFLAKVLRPVDILIGGIIGAGKFMVEGFKMWKKDHCPQIVWE